MSSERAEPPAKADNHGMPGKILAAQREAMAWSVEQVADQLKLAVRQVVALEAGDYAKLPGPAVVRGFVRAYAKIVKLDPMPLVAMISIDSLGMGMGEAVRRERPAAFSEVRFSSRGNRPALPLLPIAVAVVMIVAAAAAWNFGLVARLLTRAEAPANAALTPSLTPALTPSLAPSPAATTSSQGIAAPDATAPQNASVPLISVPPPSVSAAGSQAAGGAQVQGVGPAVPVPVAVPAVAPANALVITVREDSWIELKRAKGAPLIARVLKAGSTESFEVTEPVTLIVGKPGAVAVTLRGAPLELPGAAAGAVSRLNLK